MKNWLVKAIYLRNGMYFIQHKECSIARAFIFLSRGNSSFTGARAV